MKFRITGIAAAAAVGLIALTACGSSTPAAQNTTSAPVVTSSAAAPAGSSASSAPAGSGASSAPAGSGASSAPAGSGASSAPAGSGASSAPSAGGKRACVLLPDADSSSRWENGDRPALTKDFAAAGFTTDVQNALADTGKYATLADQMMTKGCSVLLLVDLTGAGVQVTTKAHAQGIPVIAYDRPIKGADLYISFDNFHVGELEGQMIVDALKAEKKDVATASIVYVGGDPADGNAKQFHDGADKALKAAGLVKPAFETAGIWDAAKSGVAFQQAYTALSGKIDAVWVANDTNAGGVIQVLDKNGLKVPVSGQDASPIGLQNILLGKQTATVYKPFQLEAKAAVEAGIKLANKEKVATTKTAADGTPFVAETPIVVDAKNMEQVFKDGNAKVSDVCTGPVAAACTAAGIK
jgi:D-xylose transport system substrate-binding protein